MLNLQLSPLAGWFLGPGPYSYYSWQEVATSKDAVFGDNSSFKLSIDIWGGLNLKYLNCIIAAEYNCLDVAGKSPPRRGAPA